MIFTGDIALPKLYSPNISGCPSAKVWVGNLEGSLIVRSHSKGISGVFNDFEAITDLIKRIPFRVFSLANNHLLDAADVTVSLDNLKRIGVNSLGGGENLEEASKPCIINDQDGTDYCILSYGWKNIQCKYATVYRQGVNPLTRRHVINTVNKYIKQYKNVICFFHWNYELELYPQPYDRQLAHDLIDLGVCAVIGCHAHRVQPIEFYKGHPIVYGLGNFLFFQSYYFNESLRFPAYCEDEYAFEIFDGGKSFRLHYFKYDLNNNVLSYVGSNEISQDKSFRGKASFTGYSPIEYESFFQKNRVKKSFLPVFRTQEAPLMYSLKSIWIKIRGVFLFFLVKIHFKSPNRAHKK